MSKINLVQMFMAKHEEIVVNEPGEGGGKEHIYWDSKVGLVQRFNSQKSWASSLMLGGAKGNSEKRGTNQKTKVQA